MTPETFEWWEGVDHDERPSVAARVVAVVCLALAAWGLVALLLSTLVWLA